MHYMATIIVAFNRKRVIGKENGIPWHLPEDMELFKKRTTGHPVLMGRKTWESLPKKFRPLPKRLNLIVSKTYSDSPNLFLDSVSDPDVKGDVANVFGSIDKAVTYAAMMKPGSEIYVIGGGDIYKECLERGLVDRIIASEVDNDVDGDVFFPQIDHPWVPTRYEDHTGFKVVEYVLSQQASRA